MVSQVFRQAWRAVAVYFSDLLLWFSVASFIEIAAILGAGILCILSAGFFFEGMKKNPVIMVLGGAVALSGTFLMFREVRAMLPWPSAGAAPAAERPAAAAKPSPAPPTAARPSGAPAPDTRGTAPRLPTMKDVSGPTLGTWTACVLHGKQEPCEKTLVCYWSKLTSSCQPLRFGAGQFGGQPPSPQPERPLAPR